MLNRTILRSPEGCQTLSLWVENFGMDRNEASLPRSTTEASEADSNFPFTSSSLGGIHDFSSVRTETRLPDGMAQTLSHGGAVSKARREMASAGASSQACFIDVYTLIRQSRPSRVGRASIAVRVGIEPTNGGVSDSLLTLRPSLVFANTVPAINEV